MAIIEEDIGDLLKYMPDYGIIICRKCGYAIQPHALDPHLLRHSIYRGDRQRLLERLSDLKLRQPHSVPTPPSSIPPFPELPAYNGQMCLWSGCTHACVSQKRMEQHWSQIHGEQNAKKVHSRPATLQTFFKGNKVRYFEVAAEGSESTSPLPLSMEFDDAEIPGDPAPPLNLQDIAYFHHYRNSPCLVPQRSMLESKHFWTTELFELAFEFEFLVHGILGAAAAHMASEAQSADVCEKHYVAAVRYQAAGMPLFQETMKQPDSRNSTALLVYTRFLGLQRIVLQRLERDVISLGAVCQRLPALETVLETFILYRGTEVVLHNLQRWLPSDSGFVSKKDTSDFLDLTEIEDRWRTGKCLPTVLFDSTGLAARIASLPQALSADLSSSNTNEVGAIYQATAALVLAISHSFSHAGRELDTTGAIWTGMAVFALSVSEDFVTMLKAHHPAALVLLAYWCALWSELEEYYPLLHGNSARLLQMVKNGLDPAHVSLISRLD